MTFARRAAREEQYTVIEDVADLGWHGDLGRKNGPPIFVGTTQAVVVRMVATWVRTNGPIVLNEDLDGLGHMMQAWSLFYKTGHEGQWGTRWQSADTELGGAVARSLVKAGALVVVNETHVRTRKMRPVMRVVNEGLDGWEAVRLLQLLDNEDRA